jgi:hypothetical protein
MRTRIVVPVVIVCAAVPVGAAAVASDRTTAPTERAAQGVQNRALFAVLNGRNEVGTDGRKNAGDRNGRGTFTAVVDGDQLCFGITVKNIDTPAAAHIHEGGPSVAGDIVVPLTEPAGGDPGASSDCVTADTTLLRAIIRQPRRYYVNVHTTAFGGGAVRGQLFRR